MRWWAALLGPALLLPACQPAADAAERTVQAPEARRIAREVPEKGAANTRKVALFAGGCFWGVEGVFSHMQGVSSAVSGYHGGQADNASYDSVSTGKTGHAETVRVIYDPAVVRYDQLLQVFFSVVADPTLLNRQGPDQGTQYRSALIPLDAEQAQVASAYLAQLRASDLWARPLVTRIEAYRRFYPAEAYHQDYMRKNPQNPYILRWDAPKVSALKARFPVLYRAAFVRG